MGNGAYYDDLETRDMESRRAAQLAALREQIAHAKARAPYFAKTLKGIDAEAIASLEDLAKLPVTRKADLADRQKEDSPLGGLNATPIADLAHIFMSPGPIFEPDTMRPDYWRFARSLWAAGARPGDIVHNTFSYHMTPAGMLVESAARAIGCPVFPAGVGNTDLQVEALQRIGARFYAGTPSFLKIILDRAGELGADIGTLTHALVGGEALPPSLRQEFAERGVSVLQNYGTADLGLIAYESEAREGMIIDEGVIVEIVRPGTGDPVAEGEVGEVVVTTLNPDYPLIRFATGDLSAIMPGQSPCGRTNLRLRGWMGRADQSAKVKGMFVHPRLVAEFLARHDGLGKARLVIDNQDNRDSMVLRCEAENPDAWDIDALRSDLQAVFKLRGEVEIVAPGTLPNDGKVIDDIRRYE